MISSVLVIGCSNQENTGEFSIADISTGEKQAGQKYFMVMPFEWSGEGVAEIQSIDIVKDGKLITSDAGISYTFYGGNPAKKTGVYGRSDIGEKEPINGFIIEEASTLILEISLQNVHPNEDRALHVIYLNNGKEKEQVLHSSLIEGLTTQS
ncbi:hypothetical protein [Paraliobacillus ryukyuensis]|uniref:hypothetical protein n=1 Tax=Paraliobacillus ryukyuensis TaxID=200904 RepID=UPI0009A617AE|nr:hypothetical protein [Paraliobacillus ryukyuensis]